MRPLPFSERVAKWVIVAFGLVALLVTAGVGSGLVYSLWVWALTDRPCLL